MSKASFYLKKYAKNKKDAAPSLPKPQLNASYNEVPFVCVCRHVVRDR